MSWFSSSWSELAITSGKAALMYATALAGLRLGERRTLAQWTIIDYVAAVAIGAIVGRTATASTQTYAVGATALLTLILLHRLTSLARFQPRLRRLMDHRIRVLIADGELQDRQLRRCGLTRDDVLAELRQRGQFDLNQIRYLLYETKGGLTIVPAGTADTSLIQAGLSSSAGRADRPPRG